jgi:hypothetical protein
LLAFLCLLSAPATADGLPGRVLVGYHDSWNEWPATAAGQTSLARMPGHVNVVMLAFAKPDAVYRGGLDLAATGLEYRMSGAVLRDAVAALKARNPETRVLLSVGGAAYRRWSGLAMPAIAALVGDLGLDGMDIDYEPRNPFCAGLGGRISCATDERWETIVRESRAALPRPLLLTASVWSVGAYGEGNFATSQPRSRYTGFSLAILRSKLAGELDLLAINGYDAGPSFDPLEAFRAYRAVWPGKLALGLAVRRKGGSGPFPTAARAEALARQVARDPQGGMMLYPLLAMPDGGGPSASDLAGALCRGLGMAGCAVPIP